MIELLEYVLRNATLSALPSRGLAYEDGGALDERPLEEPDDTVSKESVPCSSESDMGGSGGTMSAGASSPFFVVDVDREPRLKRPLAFGAEATRRIKRDAEIPIDLGDKGPLDRDFKGVGGLVDGVTLCGWAVRGNVWDSWVVRDKFVRCLSTLLFVRNRLDEGPTESASVELGGCELRYGG